MTAALSGIGGGSGFEAFTQGIGSGFDTLATDGATSKADSPADSFASVLGTKIRALDAQQADASKATQDMATGNVDDVAQTMLRIQQADISLQVATQVRNKVIEAYTDIIHMQV